MSAENKSNATTRADNLDQPTANSTSGLSTENDHKAYPNEANESSGAGSPYGGTQSADNKAPDGNQQVNRGATRASVGAGKLPEGAGDEYDSKSSYGDPGDNPEGGADSGSDAAGSPVR